MKVKVVAGKIYLPKEMRRAGNLSEGSEWEATVLGDEIRLRPIQPKMPKTALLLKKGKAAQAAIDDMVRAEVVDDA